MSLLAFFRCSACVDAKFVRAQLGHYCEGDAQSMHKSGKILLFLGCFFLLSPPPLEKFFFCPSLLLFMSLLLLFLHLSCLNDWGNCISPKHFNLNLVSSVGFSFFFLLAQCMKLWLDVGFLTQEFQQCLCQVSGRHWVFDRSIDRWGVTVLHHMGD